MGFWDKPLIIALAILVLTLGNFYIWDRVITGIGIFLFFIYYLYREKEGFARQLAVRNLMGLFPGNLLLLLGISTMEACRSYLLWIWLLVLLGTVVFDFLANRSKINLSIPKTLLGGIYLFIWSSIFFLIYMWITLGGKVSPEIKAYLSWGIIAVGAVFLSIGIYRFATLKLVKDEREIEYEGDSYG